VKVHSRHANVYMHRDKCLDLVLPSGSPQASTSCASAEPAVPGRSMWPSSAPWPLWPLFRPGKGNREMEDGAVAPVLSWCSPPNLEKKPRLREWCGGGGGSVFCSSLSPTSSKPSSGVGGSRSKRRSLMDDLGSRGKRAESRL